MSHSAQCTKRNALCKGWAASQQSPVLLLQRPPPASKPGDMSFFVLAPPHVAPPSPLTPPGALDYSLIYLLTQPASTCRPCRSEPRPHPI